MVKIGTPKKSQFTINNYSKKYRQRICFTGNSNDWHVHHIDGNRQNNDVQNLVLIPAELHMEYHKAEYYIKELIYCIDYEFGEDGIELNYQAICEYIFTKMDGCNFAIHDYKTYKHYWYRLIQINKEISSHKDEQEDLFLKNQEIYSNN